MKTVLKLSGVTVLLSLAACQTLPSGRQPVPAAADPTPPAMERPVNPSAASRQPQSAAVITLHLAQPAQEPSLVTVNVGGQAPLYAVPQPVLTHEDIARISPVTARDQRTYLMLEMNPAGAQKLRAVTEQARGNFLLMSVQGQLVSVAQIGNRIADGRLLIATQGAEHTQAIIRLLQGQ